MGTSLSSPFTTFPLIQETLGGKQLLTLGLEAIQAEQRALCHQVITTGHDFLQHVQEFQWVPEQ